MQHCKFGSNLGWLACSIFRLLNVIALLQKIFCTRFLENLFAKMQSTHCASEYVVSHRVAIVYPEVEILRIQCLGVADVGSALYSSSLP